MTDILDFAPALRLGVTTTSEDLVTRLGGLIFGLAGRLEQGLALGEAAQRVFAQFPQHAGLFELRGDGPGATLRLKPEVLYAAPRILSMFLQDEQTQRGRRIEVPEAEQPAALELMGRCATGSFLEEELRPLRERLSGSWVDDLLEVGALRRVPRPAHGTLDLARPGIHRLQHSALLYRTRTTGVLVDPYFHFASRASTGGLSLDAKALVGHVDAILLSHGHNDHFSLPSLSLFPRDLPIIVPKVPRATLLCDDFVSRLRGLGFTRVLEKEWYSEPFRIGDITLQALPFYGEQATLREQPLYEDAWNWGNTYWVELDGFTSWFLIDSGSDVRGSMAEVADYVLSRHGRVDCLLSNMKPFKLMNPLYINLGANWLTLSGDQMARFHHMREDVITLGVDGIAQLCERARARYFLPYAHWWHEPGVPLPKEGDAVQRLRERLAVQAPETRCIDWTVGGSFFPERAVTA